MLYKQVKDINLLSIRDKMTSLPERCEFKGEEEKYGDKRIGICSISGGKCYFSVQESIDCAQKNMQLYGSLRRPYSNEELEKLAQKHEVRLEASRIAYERWLKEKR